MADHLFIDFANSAEYDGHGNLEDRLLDPDWARELSTKWGLASFDPLSTDEVRQLSRLRSTVRAIADCARLERHPTSDHIATVNEFLAAVPFRFELAPGGDALYTSTDSPSPVAGAAAEIALSVARYLTGGEYERLKMCDNAGCRWMFHDDTKNRSRRWCRVCGNVDKVRRFRERQRAREHDDHAPPAGNREKGGH